MARVLIRNDTREILFFTQNSAFLDTDARIVGISAKYPGNSSFLTLAANVPNNLAIGHYLSSDMLAASTEPYGAVLLARQRKAQFLAKLDEHQTMIIGGAMSTVPAEAAALWYKYLRMMTQASMIPDAFSDDVQWGWVSQSLDLDPFDFGFPDFTSTSVNTVHFNENFADDGEYALGWFDIDTKVAPVRTDMVADEKRDVSSSRFDRRFASAVHLIPESEIDRTTDTTLFPERQEWTRRAEVVAEINKRFPWYATNADANILLLEYTPNVFDDPYPLGRTRSANVENAVASVLLAVQPSSHSATVVITSGIHTSRTGSLQIPLAVGANVITVVITSGNGANTTTHTDTITRRTA